MADSKDKYWGRFADTYDEYTDYVVGKSLRRSVIDRILKENFPGEVLEIGCGPGYYTSAIAERASHVTATDISDEMIRAVRKKTGSAPNVTAGKADANDLPFSSESFDAVVIANVLHAVEDPRRVLAEIMRVLKPGAAALIICYTDCGMNWFERIIIGMKFIEKFGSPPPYGLRNYSPEELASLIRSAGFEVETLELIGGKPKAMYAKAKKVSGF